MVNRKSKSKIKDILKNGEIHGKKLTEEKRKRFEAMINIKKNKRR